MYKYAPVIIFAFNRLEHLKVTIECLKNNIHALSTDLIIFSDKEKKVSDNIKVKMVRSFLKSISGFKSITVVFRNTNYGLAKNIIEGVTEVINIHGKVIVLEDDLLTSKNFISYMNKTLDFYEEDNQIFSISGYTGKLKSLENLKEDVYLSYRPSSWGWATWKDQWDSIDWDVKDFDEFINDRQAVKKFNRGGIDMTRMLKHCMQGKNHSWAIRWSYSMSKQDKYCVYPKVSKVQNIGFGNDATNCTGVDIYQTNLDDGEQVKFNFTKDITIDQQIAKEFRYTFSYRNKALNRLQNYIGRFKK